MKPVLTLRFNHLIAAFVLLNLALASRSSAADTASLGLAQHGEIPVATAGPYVEIGSARILVFVKLGPPTTRLRGDIWLYRGYQVAESEAAGILAVHFVDGKVSRLGLLTRDRAATLIAAAKTSSAPKWALQDRR